MRNQQSAEKPPAQISLFSSPVRIGTSCALCVFILCSSQNQCVAFPSQIYCVPVSESDSLCCAVFVCPISFSCSPVRSVQCVLVRQSDQFSSCIVSLFHCPIVSSGHTLLLFPLSVLFAPCLCPIISFFSHIALVPLSAPYASGPCLLQYHCNDNPIRQNPISTAPLRFCNLPRLLQTAPYLFETFQTSQTLLTKSPYLET